MAGTRIILFLCLCISPLVSGSQCECESESLSHPGCGVIPTSSTIINGSAVTYPWMVFLYNYNFEDTDDSFCGGTLISDMEILTAAHCVNGRTIDDVVVIVGSDNALAELRKLNWKTLFKIELYPLYYKNMEKAFKHSSDVAILTLETSLVLNSEVNPICLPLLDESEETFEGKEAIVAGWGKTETGETSEKQLMHVKVPIISNTQCVTFYSWILRFCVEYNTIFQKLCKLFQFSPLHPQARFWPLWWGFRRTTLHPQ